MGIRTIFHSYCYSNKYSFEYLYMLCFFIKTLDKNVNFCYYFNVDSLIYIWRCTQVVEGSGFEITRNVVKLEEVPTATNPDFTGLF